MSDELKVNQGNWPVPVTSKSTDNPARTKSSEEQNTASLTDGTRSKILGQDKYYFLSPPLDHLAPLTFEQIEQLKSIGSILDVEAFDLHTKIISSSTILESYKRHLFRQLGISDGSTAVSLSDNKFTYFRKHSMEEKREALISELPKSKSTRRFKNYLEAFRRRNILESRTLFKHVTYLQLMFLAKQQKLNAQDLEWIKKYLLRNLDGEKKLSELTGQNESINNEALSHVADKRISLLLKLLRNGQEELLDAIERIKAKAGSKPFALNDQILATVYNLVENKPDILNTIQRLYVFKKMGAVGPEKAKYKPNVLSSSALQLEQELNKLFPHPEPAYRALLGEGFLFSPSFEPMDTPERIKHTLSTDDLEKLANEVLDTSWKISIETAQEVYSQEVKIVEAMRKKSNRDFGLYRALPIGVGSVLAGLIGFGISWYSESVSEEQERQRIVREDDEIKSIKQIASQVLISDRDIYYKRFYDEAISEMDLIQPYPEMIYDDPTATESKIFSGKNAQKNERRKHLHARLNAVLVVLLKPELTDKELAQIKSGRAPGIPPDIATDIFMARRYLSDLTKKAEWESIGGQREAGKYYYSSLLGDPFNLVTAEGAMGQFINPELPYRLNQTKLFERYPDYDKYITGGGIEPRDLVPNYHLYKMASHVPDNLLPLLEKRKTELFDTYTGSPQINSLKALILELEEKRDLSQKKKNEILILCVDLKQQLDNLNARLKNISRCEVRLCEAQRLIGNRKSQIETSNSFIPHQISN